MIIDLITLGNTPKPFEFTLAPNQVDLDDESAELKNPANVKGSVIRHIAQFDVEGEIEAQIKIECTRCLQTVEQELNFPFKAVFVTPENYTQAKEAELGANDLDVSIIEGNEIDLSELVREQILLNLPEQVYCSEDCKGLCEKCGANRNLIDCKCVEKEIDPRWAALKNLK